MYYIYINIYPISYCIIVLLVGLLTELRIEPKCLFISATALPEVLQLLNMDTGEVVVTGDTALAGHHRVCTPPEVCRYISICVSTLCYM